MCSFHGNFKVVCIVFVSFQSATYYSIIILPAFPSDFTNDKIYEWWPNILLLRLYLVFCTEAVIPVTLGNTNVNGLSHNSDLIKYSIYYKIISFTACQNKPMNTQIHYEDVCSYFSFQFFWSAKLSGITLKIDVVWIHISAAIIFMLLFCSSFVLRLISHFTLVSREISLMSDGSESKKKIRLCFVQVTYVSRKLKMFSSWKKILSLLSNYQCS